MKRWLASVVASIPLGMGAATAAQPQPVDAVVTIGMIGDVVANVGGECVAATAIMGAGIDPHLYRASAQDVRRFQEADVIFYSGYSLEGQLGDVMGRFAETKPTVGGLTGVDRYVGTDHHPGRVWHRPASVDGREPVG